MIFHRYQVVAAKIAFSVRFQGGSSLMCSEGAGHQMTRSCQTWDFLRWQGAVLWLAGSVGMATSPVWSQGEAPTAPAAVTKPVAPSSARWIDELSSDQFSVREAATRSLTQAGAEVIPEIVKALSSGDPEVVARSFRILDEVCRTGEETAADAADLALLRLSSDTDPALARRARRVLGNMSSVRHRRAVTKLTQWGAELAAANPLNGFMAPGMNAPSDTVSQVLLGDDFQGGDEGLIQVRRLSAVTTVYITPGAGITEKALEQAVRELPNVSFQRRSSAMLGISAQDTELGCQISTVSEDGPADRAGLQIGDFIILYDGELMSTFQQVIDTTKAHRAGDVIALEVMRNGEVLGLKITLAKFALKTLVRPR